MQPCEKKCSKCGEIKLLCEFSVRSSRKSGRQSSCKECNKNSRRKYYLENSESQKEYSRKKRNENPARARELCRKWYAENKDKAKNWYKINAKKQCELSKIWKKNNIEATREHRNRHDSKVRATNRGKINYRVSNLMRISLRGAKNGRRWTELTGYSVDDLMKHLEGQFLQGMTWDNMGEWHVDHKWPISAFEYESVEDRGFELCWSIDNLQPLWAKDNQSKGNKLIKEFEPNKEVCLAKI